MENKIRSTTPYGPLGVIALHGCSAMGERVDQFLVKWRHERLETEVFEVYEGYEKDSYLIENELPRFGSGEGKGVIRESVRGMDLYLMVDVCNFSATYTISGKLNPMSPDDHFQNLKRIIAAVAGKARRITVIMPFLYESRQHNRSGRESLDCALALQELEKMGVDQILTFDAHDERVQNAIPLTTFESVPPAYQFVKGLLNVEPDLMIDSDHMMVISPDEGGMRRAVFLANVLGLDVGMFYKRRDYTRVVDGHNPIVAHEFLGGDIEGKDLIIRDDMISSGESVLDVARELKRRKAARIFILATFGLFTGGLEAFDRAYEEGIFDRIVTTDLIYQTPELLSRPYYTTASMSKYIALLIDTLNHDSSIEDYIEPVGRIHGFVNRYNAKNN
ncbi:MAG: ribose-phosphate pyrophosphokinase [Lachnospiraceae bacterium]|nr:ribose-phosphate pyrophosphokinase [Lachnospiraceae bacterium]